MVETNVIQNNACNIYSGKPRKQHEENMLLYVGSKLEIATEVDSGQHLSALFPQD